MTHAQRQKAYRERQGWALRRKNRDRMREARGTPVRDVCVTIGTSVRDAKRPVREVQETHYETDDEAYEREHAPRVAPIRQMEPKPEVVVPEVAITDEERRVTLWLESRKNGRPAAETIHSYIEIDMP